MASYRFWCGVLGGLFVAATAWGADELPFQHKVEVFRSDTDNVIATATLPQYTHVSSWCALGTE